MIRKNQMQFAALACALLLSSTTHSESNLWKTVTNKENRQGAFFIAGILALAGLAIYDYKTEAVRKKAKDLYSKWWKKGASEELEPVKVYYTITEDGKLTFEDAPENGVKTAYVSLNKAKAAEELRNNPVGRIILQSGSCHVVLDEIVINKEKASQTLTQFAAEQISKQFFQILSTKIEEKIQKTKKLVENENVTNLIQQANIWFSKNLAQLNDEQDNFDKFMTNIKDNTNPVIQTIFGAYKNIETLKTELKYTVPTTQFTKKTTELETIKSELQDVKKQLTEKTQEVEQLKNNQQPQLQNNQNNQQQMIQQGQNN